MHSRLVFYDDKGCAVEQGVREDGCAHTGGGVVVVGGFGEVGDANACQLYGEEEEGAEVRGMVVEVGPPRRAGRKAVRMAVSIGAK